MAPRTKSPTLTTTRGTPSPQTSSSLKQNYLLAYNAVSFALWSILTLRMAMLVPMLAPRHDLAGVFDHLFSPLLTFSQSLAILEVVHALVGLVRASPVTTLMQVASRYLVVWFVCFVFPEIIVGKELPVGKFRMGGSGLGQWAFIGCLAAWGPTEMIKYGYFVYQLGLGGAPRWLNWLRYVLKLHIDHERVTLTSATQVQHLFCFVPNWHLK